MHTSDTTIAHDENSNLKKTNLVLSKVVRKPLVEPQSVSAKRICINQTQYNDRATNLIRMHMPFNNHAQNQY